MFVLKQKGSKDENIHRNVQLENLSTENIVQKVSSSYILSSFFEGILAKSKAGYFLFLFVENAIDSYSSFNQ
jgi:hypothetical protein